MGKNFALQWLLHSDGLGQFLSMEKTSWAVVIICANLGSKVKGHHITKYGQKYSFGATTPIKCKILRQSQQLIGAVLSISENLRSKGQRQSFLHDQKWAKLQFCISSSIQMYQMAIVVNGKTYWACVKSHHITKYGQ